MSNPNNLIRSPVLSTDTSFNLIPASQNIHLGLEILMSLVSNIATDIL